MDERKPERPLWKQWLPGVAAILAVPLLMIIGVKMAYQSSPVPGKVDEGVFNTGPPTDIQKLTELRDSVEDCAAIGREIGWIRARMQRAYTKVEGDYFVGRLKRLDERLAARKCAPSTGKR